MIIACIYLHFLLYQEITVSGNEFFFIHTYEQELFLLRKKTDITCQILAICEQFLSTYD